MTNKILKERIAGLEESIDEINRANDEGEESDYSIAIDNMNGALEIIKELQSKPCEYIHQGKDGTSYCKLAASQGKELEEARRVIEAGFGEWQDIESCPSDIEVLLYCPARHISNPERIELDVFRCTKGGHSHSWATHFMLLPKPPTN